MDPEEIDWILAHEIAHNTYRRSLLIFVPILLLAAVTLSLYSGDMTMKIWTLAPIALLIILGSAIFRVSRNRKLEADRIALEVTRNLLAAESALNHLAEASQNPELTRKGSTSNPNLEKRIKSLRETAVRLGLIMPDVDP